MASVLRASEATVFQSCRNLTDQILSNAKLVETAWRLAANVRDLQKDIVVLESRTQPIKEWAAVQIDEARLQHKQRKDRIQFGAELVLRVLLGRLASRHVAYWLSLSQCSFLAGLCGFTRANGTRPYAHVSLLTSLRIACYLLPAENMTGTVFRIDRLDCPQSLVTYNKTILKRRYRRTSACPLEYAHECHECVVGYDNCEVATHPTTYFQRRCMLCNDHDAWFDPRNIAACLRCQEKE